MRESCFGKPKQSEHNKQKKKLAGNMHKRNHLQINRQTVHVEGGAAKDLAVCDKCHAPDEETCHK